MLTTQQAADRLGVSRSAILKAIGRGKLRAVRFGRDWTIAPDALDKYQNSNLGPGRPPMKTITVKAQLPTTANLSIPQDTPVTIVSQHRATKRGAANALKSRRNVHGDYIHTHGNAAAGRVWIEVDGREISPLDLAVEFDIEYHGA
jgi:excisionase family DNA binding protein